MRNLVYAAVSAQRAFVYHQAACAFGGIDGAPAADCDKALRALRFCHLINFLNNIGARIGGHPVKNNIFNLVFNLADHFLQNASLSHARIGYQNCLLCA
ncbi:hypothetical protein SDC9_102567 [bioreactor metagenome]|uniref:Uncharacterized protein n=1 Tax=bioreactor metagenome TaxID=1076179 RepID=A0A645ARP5_9ZZZZ